MEDVIVNDQSYSRTEYAFNQLRIAISDAITTKSN